MTSDPEQPQTQTAAKLITCILPDNGTDKVLMKALRHEKQTLRANSTACRGIAILQPGLQSMHDKLPQPTLVRMVKVVVPEDEANELFDYIYETAGIGHKGGGALYMGPLINATPFELPDDVPDEKV